jgi:predicted MFS family arabinose efflux permease
MTALLPGAATVRQYVMTPDNGHGGPEDDIRRSAKAQPAGPGQVPGPEGERRAAFRDVFAVGEFRALWLAQILSVAGDQLARVALTVLVYDRTRSALLAAVTYAASIVPTFLGGVLLASLADRRPRREVMIACDVVRCVLVLVMAVPGLPVGALVALLVAVTLVGAPFTSARAAIYPDVLTGDSYVLGTAVTLTTYQAAQVLGFVAGGTLVATLGIRTSLVADAATFAASALIVRAWTRWRPAARGSGPPAAGRGPERSGRLARAFSGARLVLATPALRTPMFYGWLAAFYNAPEGIAAPLARVLGGGSVTVGLVLGAEAFGSTAGAVAFSRLVDPPRRLRWMGPLAIAACGTLLLFAARPRLPAALAILAVSGVCACYQLAANAAFVSAAPPGHRSQAFGLAQGGMNLGQGLVMILAGAAAGRFSPGAVVVVCGGAGVAAALAIAVGGSRGRHLSRP